jgi:hypothetical protein
VDSANEKDSVASGWEVAAGRFCQRLLRTDSSVATIHRVRSYFC